jgi:hypothetical protein
MIYRVLGIRRFLQINNSLHRYCKIWKCSRFARWHICIPKIQILVQFWRPRNGKFRYILEQVVIFKTVCCILWPFGVFVVIWCFCGQLVFLWSFGVFVVIWYFWYFFIYIFAHFGVLYREKSGNHGMQYHRNDSVGGNAASQKRYIGAWAGAILDKQILCRLRSLSFHSNFLLKTSIRGVINKRMYVMQGCQIFLDSVFQSGENTQKYH